MFLLAPEVLAKSGAPFADVATRLWGSNAGHAIAAFAAISGIGALNGWILLSGEVPFRLAQRGVFPAVFGRETRRHAPAFALCVSSVLVTLLVLLNLGKETIEVFKFMLLLSTTSTLALYLTCSLGLLLLARRGALGALGAHVRWLVVAGALGALYSLWTLYGAGKEALLWGLVLFAVAVPVFFLMKRVAVPAPEHAK
jgi:APA family basic amino acid/polyamine antiporter